jgi:putative ABC transport system substrate-binding protein
MTDGRSAQPVRRPGDRMGRRELMFLLAGAMTASLPIRAQHKGMLVIGFLSGSSPATFAPLVAAVVRQGLSETGYIEGQNVAIEYRWAERHYDRLPALAATSSPAMST